MRNSSRTMRRAWSSRRVLLPGPRGRPTGGGRFPPRVWFWFWPHRTDRFRHALKTHTGRSVSFFPFGTRVKVARRDRRKFSLTIQETPALPSRSCGEFPGKGRTLPSRHFLVVSAPIRAGPSHVSERQTIGAGGWRIDGSGSLGVKYVSAAASGVPPGDAGAAAASPSNSSGVR